MERERSEKLRQKAEKAASEKEQAEKVPAVLVFTSSCCYRLTVSFSLLEVMIYG